MSLSLAIALNPILAVSLLGALAYSMSHAARLSPHRPAARPPALRGLPGDRARPKRRGPGRRTGGGSGARSPRDPGRRARRAPGRCGRGRPGHPGPPAAAA